MLDIKVLQDILIHPRYFNNYARFYCAIRL